MIVALLIVWLVTRSATFDDPGSSVSFAVRVSVTVLASKPMLGVAERFIPPCTGTA